jgi:hypothetical protein
MPLIDDYLPDHHFAETHSLVVDAPPGALLDLVMAQDAEGDPLIRRLIALRELPSRLAGALGRPSMLKARPSFGLHEFTPLGRDGDREIAFGLVGQFWRTDYGLRRIASAEDYAAFCEPGVAKLAMNFSTEPAGQGTRLITHTRIFCPDAATRRRLLPYWLLIRPASGLIRRRILRRIKRAAEAREPR